MIAVGIEAVIFIIEETGNRPTEYTELSGMGMTRKREGWTAFDDLSTPMGWVVGEDDWVMVFRAF